MDSWPGTFTSQGSAAVGRLYLLWLYVKPDFWRCMHFGLMDVQLWVAAVVSLRSVLREYALYFVVLFGL